ncbi:hypothetical protein TA3x_000468 [Tundrisphaera sp. TA3]|uniref:hypothetical protein n=1 Tax=Tundrisphaera sp. TA3 TaxID=3435775 RepID=UPI003EB7FEFC
MPKVTFQPHPEAETPSQSIVKAANQVLTVTDALGREIGIRKLNALDRIKMFEVVGSENSSNQAYMIYASAACHAASIDGEAVSRPATRLQLEALVKRLDEEGIEAILGGLQEQYAAKEAAGE